MIAYLRGTKIGIEPESVVVDVNGVGYEVHCSAMTRDQLSIATDVELYIYTAVREDAITLYGFRSLVEKQLFLTLIKVNGVGPKLAIGILSGAPVEKILVMIESEDVRGLCLLPKVGKKTAEQLILSLKGKLPKLDPTAGDEKTRKGRAFVGGARGDIVSALVNLGFRLQDVERAVEEMDADVDVEAGVRRGLTALSQL